LHTLKPKFPIWTFDSRIIRFACFRHNNLPPEQAFFIGKNSSKALDLREISPSPWVSFQGGRHDSLSARCRT
jgi:hypothetical protein